MKHFKINKRFGSYRKVFIFKNIVIKIPRDILGMLVNMNEIYNWHHYKKLRQFLCPIIFHDLLGLIIIMKKADIPSDTKYNNNYLREFRDRFISEDFVHPIANDIKLYNFGILNNSIVKIDYGNDYWLYNIFIGIRNKINNIM